MSEPKYKEGDKILIDEKWLEDFVRNMIDKILEERAEKQTKKHDRWVYTENK